MKTKTIKVYTLYLYDEDNFNQCDICDKNGFTEYFGTFSTKDKAIKIIKELCKEIELELIENEHYVINEIDVN